MNDPNEKRTLVAIALSLVVFLAWSAFFGPKPKPPEEAGAPAPAADVAEAPGAPEAAVPPTVPAPVADATEAPCVPKPVKVTTSIVEMTLDNCSGSVSDLALPAWHDAVEVTPWWMWIWRTVTGNGPGAWTPTAEHAEVRRLLGAGSDFAVAGRGEPGVTGTFTVEGTDGVTTLRRMSADGLVTTKTLATTADPDLFELTVTFESATPLNGPFWVGIADVFADAKGAYDMAPKLAAVVDGDLEQLTTPSDVTGTEPFEGPVSWFGVEDRYFLAALVPADPAWGTLRWTRLQDGRTGAYLVGQSQGISPGQPLVLKFKVFTGAKYPERLNQIGSGLEEAANLGFFGFFAKILLFFLDIFHAGLGNWGLSILALTFFVRVAFYPLSAKAFRSAKMMQAVQPKLKAVQEKYADDKEAQTRETMALFQKYGVNPLGGCLPMLLQMPVFFALYSALLNSPDLYHADFLYVHDLSSPDPFGVFPFLMAIGMVLQQRMTPMQGMDPAQQQIMRWMPLMFALFMFGLPAGLSLYYALNTALSIAQQWYNTHSYKPVAIED